jgi:hypothetical protein
MKEPLKLSGKQWQQLTEITIIDADGWDRSNWNESWNEPISFDEFLHCLSLSTTMPWTERQLVANAMSNFVIGLTQ